MAHRKCHLSPVALHLPLGEDEIGSLCRGLGHPKVARLLFCLATAGTRILLQVCALGVDARRVSESCRGGNPTTQSWDPEAQFMCSPTQRSAERQRHLPAPGLSSALRKEKPLLSISVAFSGFQRPKQCHISLASSFCHSRPHTSPTKTQYPNLPTFTIAV